MNIYSPVLNVSGTNISVTNVQVCIGLSFFTIIKHLINSITTSPDLELSYHPTPLHNSLVSICTAITIIHTYIIHLQIWPQCTIPTTVIILCSMRNKFLINPITQLLFQPDYCKSHVCVVFWLR